MNKISPIMTCLRENEKAVTVKIAYTSYLKKMSKDFCELILPPRCRVCGRGDTLVEGMCANCLADVSYVVSPICTICGRDFPVTEGGDHICGKCLRQPPPFFRARAITYYEEPVRSLLHHLKYNFDTTVIQPLAKIAQNGDISVFDSCDCVVPVPLHSKRLQSRGSNQALALARLLFAHRHGIIVPDSLIKTRNTVSQTELDGDGRRRALRGAFAVKNPENIENMTVCLVDDIYTTGTTVSECAKVLYKGGASSVVVLTFARVREGR